MTDRTAAAADRREAVRRVAEHYSRRAERFAAGWAPRLRQRSEELLKRLPIRSARLVLDLGTGTGGLLASIRSAAPAAVVVGIDVAEGMLGVAQAEAGGPLALMDAHQLGLRGGCADGAVLSFVLHRLPDPGAALAEVARVLRPGGVVGTVTWGRSRRSEAGRIWDEILAGRGLAGDRAAVDNHALVDAPARLRALALGAGLEPVAAWARTDEERHDLERWLAAASGAELGRTLAAPDPALVDACRREARARMASLAPDAFVQRTEVVYAVARRRAD
jgi:ubiquinone/menaquinone biosynthesis C-methylase UbiE